MMVQCNVSRFARNMTLLMNLYIIYNKIYNEIYLYSEKYIYIHIYNEISYKKYI